MRVLRLLALACLVVAPAAIVRDARANDPLPDPVECDALTKYHDRLEATARQTISKSDLFRDRAETLAALKREVADEARWKTSDAIVLAAVTKRAVDTIMHLTAMAADFDPELAELEWIPKTYDCVQAVVAAAKGEETNYKDCVAATVRRKELKNGPISQRKALKDGLKVMMEEVKSLTKVVKTEEDRQEARRVVEAQIAAIDDALAEAEGTFAFEESLLQDLQAEALRVRTRIGQCSPGGRRLGGRPPIASAIPIPANAPMRALIATTILSDPAHARADATSNSIADAQTIVADAVKLRVDRMPAGVEPNDVPALPDTSVETELTGSPANRAVVESARYLSHAVQVADDALESSIQLDLTARLHEHNIKSIDASQAAALLDQLYPKAKGALAVAARDLIRTKRVSHLQHDGDALLKAVVGASDASAADRIDALATVIANTQGQYGSAFSKAQDAAQKFEAAVHAVRALTKPAATQGSPDGLPDLAGAVLVERGLGGTESGSLSQPPSVFANPKTSLEEVGNRVQQAVDVARTASDLAQVLPLPENVKREFAKASQVGAVASQLFSAALSGNPLSAVSALGSLIGGGPDASAIEAEHHAEVMRTLGVIEAQQQQILDLEKQIRKDISDLRAEVQAMQAKILEAIDGIDLRIEFNRELIASGLEKSLGQCSVTAKYLEEHWQRRHRRFFVFDGDDQKFFASGIRTYLGQCAHGIREEIEGSDPQNKRPIGPLFAAATWEKHGETFEKLQKSLFPAAYKLEETLRDATAFDERWIQTPSRTWLELKEKLASPSSGDAPTWNHQQDLLSPDYLVDVGSRLIAVLPLLEIARSTAADDKIRLCDRDDVVEGRCWKAPYARNALNAYARIVDVALYQQSLLAGDALLSAALDALDTNTAVAPALIAYVQSNPMSGRNLGLLLSFRAMERTNTAVYRIAWNEPKPDMLQALLHVTPIDGATGNWHWHFVAGDKSVDVPLPNPDEAELRVFELPTGVTNLTRLRTQIASELAGYEIATTYSHDGRAFVDAIVEPSALPQLSNAHATQGCHGCTTGSDGAVAPVLAVFLVLRRRRKKRGSRRLLSASW